MVRSLWTAASGMNAQQTNVDTIANNLANVNTAGYKSQEVSFKTLLYQNLQTPTSTANGNPKPTNAQVGLGTRVSAIVQSFTQGPLLSNDSPSALAISGDGFFGFLNGKGEICYTRNGNFTWALDDSGNLELTTEDGSPVMGTDGQKIVVNGAVASKIEIDSEGRINYPDENGTMKQVGNLQVGLWQFSNREGLERVGDSAWIATQASGQAINENTGQVKRSSIAQGYLEGSNVNVATEMVNLIAAQRSYELNSVAIRTTDEMMQTANQLKR